MIKRYSDIEVVVQSWQRQRVFSTVGIRNLVKSLQVFIDIDEIFKSIKHSEVDCEIMRMHKAVERSKVEQLIKVIVSSIELESSRT